MRAKEHYDRHLGAIYAWMMGDFDAKQKEFQQFLITHGLVPESSQAAIDLGAGHGIQSVSLAKVGYKVVSVDFNRQLLHELRQNSKGLPIDILEDDIRQVKKYASLSPELIVCWGDTITHLDSKKDSWQFIVDACATLGTGGKLVLSFRDYTVAAEGTSRFIPVRSDDSKILTCFLEYSREEVTVTDLLYQKTTDSWLLTSSSYKKVRILPNDILEWLQENGMHIKLHECIRGLVIIIAQKQ